MRDDFAYHLTAEEAWPAFERHVLSARRRIVAGFRVFDPMTRLRTEEAQEIGAHWFDLFVHVLRQGVRVDIILSDFDPIVAPDMHQSTWASMRKFAAIREEAGPEAQLNVVPALHPAQAGKITRTAFWPKVWQELTDLRDNLNELEPAERRTAWGDLPGAHPWLILDGEGQARTRNAGPPPLHTVSYHHKLAVIDSRILYLGGLDLNPRRYDSPRHHRAAAETWHDVQISVEGPVAEVAERYLDTVVDVINGRAEPVEESHGFCCTISAAKKNLVAMSPRIVRRSIAETTHDWVRQSEGSLYFETQFFRDRDLARLIAERAAEAPDLELLMVLPAAPEVVAFDKRRKLDARFGEYLQAECVNRVLDAFGERAYFASPAQKRDADPERIAAGDRATFHGAPLVYVHAKVSVFDARAVLVSSANLNSRSLNWDTEAGILREDPELARSVLDRSLRHWLPDTELPAGGSLVATVREQAERDVVCQPDNRSGFLLPYDVSAAEEFGVNLPGVPHALV